METFFAKAGDWEAAVVARAEKEEAQRLCATRSHVPMPSLQPTETLLCVRRRTPNRAKKYF